MLNILKKFRRKNLESSKMKRIILYALGEILLVVVGILIAVQLNNWNTDRKLHLVESITLERLSEDLENDLKRYEWLIARLDDRVKRADSVLTLIRTQSSKRERLALMQIQVLNYFLIEPNTITYEEMRNTGRIYSLNNEVRSRIIGYYRSVEKWERYFENDNSQLRIMEAQANFSDYRVVRRRIGSDAEINSTEFPWLDRQNSRELKDIEALTIATRDVLKDHLGRLYYLERVCQELLELLKDKKENN